MSEVPHLDLPVWATQAGSTLYVGTSREAMQLLDYIPEELDHLYSVVVKEQADSLALSRLAKRIGLWINE